jgi:hypothetical protein
MQDALPIVIIAVVGIAAVVALLTLARGKGVYDDIRAGDMAPRTDPAHLREAEIAQMRAALQARREARGESGTVGPDGGPVGPGERARTGDSGEAGGRGEVAGTGVPSGEAGGRGDVAGPRVPIDDDLRAEVRALAEARNARRVARGEAPLDVDAEVERRLAELDG